MVAIFFYIRSRNSNVLNVHGSVGDGDGDSTYEKALDIELTGLKSDKERIVIHKETKHQGSGLESKGGGIYETVTEMIPSRYEVVGGVSSEVKNDRTYSTVDDCADQLQGGYSKIDNKELLAGYSEVAQPNNFSEADDPIYSNPDVVPKQIFTSPPSVSLQSKPSAVPRPIQDSEYAVIGTTGAPEIPKKSDILVDYLENKAFKVADKKPEVSESDDGSCGYNGGGGGGSDMVDEYSRPDKHLSQ